MKAFGKVSAVIRFQKPVPAFCIGSQGKIEDPVGIFPVKTFILCIIKEKDPVAGVMYGIRKKLQDGRIRAPAYIEKPQPLTKNGEKGKIVHAEQDIIGLFCKQRQ